MGEQGSRSTDERGPDETMLEHCGRLLDLVARLRHQVEDRDASIALQLKEIGRLRDELRVEGVTERIVMGQGIIVEGYGQTYRYRPDYVRHAPEKAAGGVPVPGRRTCAGRQRGS